jgi:hypothetical protein
MNRVSVPNDPARERRLTDGSSPYEESVLVCTCPFLQFFFYGEFRMLRFLARSPTSTGLYSMLGVRASAGLPPFDQNLLPILRISRRCQRLAGPKQRIQHLPVAMDLTRANQFL